jgi:LmbE family N-acetylglucosaminyl deacetylase
MFTPDRILILAPHTDDGELGCGGSAAKFCEAGKEVFYAAFSDCKKSLPKDLPADTLKNECKKATALLGIKASNLIFFDFEVRTFPAQRQEILEAMVKLNKSLQPDLVFIPSSDDIHQDHGVIHTEALRAFKYCSLLGYELPWNNSAFSTNCFIKISETNLQSKLTALKTYASQSQRNYFSEDFIQSLAKVRGVQSNCGYAEAFEVYKISG